MQAKFDVFLSYNNLDKQIVEKIGKSLRSEGLNVWLDRWVPRPGFPWQERLHEGIQASRAVAVFVGAGGLGTWQELEIQAFISRSRKEKIPVIPVLLPGCHDSPKLSLFLEGLTWVDLREGLTDAGLARLVWGITGMNDEENRTDTATAGENRECPSGEGGAAGRVGAESVGLSNDTKPPSVWWSRGLGLSRDRGHDGWRLALARF